MILLREELGRAKEEERERLVNEIEKHKTKGGSISGRYKDYCIIITDLQWQSLKSKE